ncbi:TetR/AcrR family transcriptional regulator [Hyphomicrobium sp.]|uniref:TetR/AcrR family transcriptional regulator n=1 Tax=Hyphomicrobium sp. TaxID=82 RepID=UPI002FE29564
MPNYLPADERRKRTVEAVVTLAGKQNPSQITTAAIAKHMSVTQGALFRHFPSKDAIWEMVMEWVAESLLNRIDRAAGSETSPLEALRAVFDSHVNFVIEHPGVPRMMFGELQRAEATPAKKVAHGLMRRYAERLTRKLEDAKKVGEVVAETDSRAAAILFIGMLQGLVMQSMLAGNIEAARINSAGVFQVFRRGVAAHRGAPRAARQNESVERSSKSRARNTDKS